MKTENKTQKFPAVKMKAKRAKLLASLKHCCIPSTLVTTQEIEYEDGSKQIVNPQIKPNGNGPIGKAGDHYKELKAERKKYLNAHFSGKAIKGHRVKRKQPWYTLTRGQCYNYEEQKASWGAHTNHFRVESEYSKLYKRTIIPKFTREELTIRLLSAKMEDWEKRNPKPSKNDMFYWQEIGPWVNRYQAAHSRVAGKLGLLSSPKVPDFVKESYYKYEIQLNKDYEEYNKAKAA